MTRGGAAAARVAHNHEVAGSSPAPATTTRVHRMMGFFRGTVPGSICDLARSEVRNASGISQGNQHLKTCFHSCCCGPAECGRVLPPLPRKEVYPLDRLFFLIIHRALVSKLLKIIFLSRSGPMGGDRPSLKAYRNQIKYCKHSHNLYSVKLLA